MVVRPPSRSPVEVEVGIPIVEEPVPEMKLVPSVDVSSLVTCIIVNFKTRDLTEAALTTFICHYPDVSVLLVDNGSEDGSTAYVEQAQAKFKTVTSVLHERNLGHGPAMHQAILQTDTRYVFTLDSDCVVNRAGFLEGMARKFRRDSSLYAIGWVRRVHPMTGVPVPDSSQKYLEYVHPSAALYDRHTYLNLPPFGHYGAPCILNMREAQKQGLHVASFPIEDYIEHLKAGTRRMYRGKWNPKEGERARPWEREGNWPI
jgi:glycosyltransferase involved in cell wall biosynthesis